MAKKRVKHVVSKRIEVVKDKGLSRHAIFSLVTLGILIVAIVAAALMFNQPAILPGPNSPTFFGGTGAGKIFDPVAQMFSQWTEGQTSVNVAKYAFIVLLILLIYAILDFVPFLKKQQDYIKWPIAIIVGFLAGAYLTPSDVYTLLTAYGAMGIVLGGIIPFIIIGFFSVEMGKEAGGWGKGVSILIWIVFIIFTIIKTIVGISNEQIGTGEGIFYLVLVVLGIIFILSYDKIASRIYLSGTRAGYRAGLMDNMTMNEAEINRLREEMSHISPGSPDADAKIARLAAKVEQLEKVNKEMVKFS